MPNTLIPQNLFEINLEQALQRGEFVLYYQPIFDVRDHSIVAAEALLRWDHPELGMLLPANFMPLIENDLAFFDLSNWVIRKASEQNMEWQKKGLKIRISVNISVRQLLYPEFAVNVKRILKEVGMNPKYLELEITETATADHIRENSRMLRELKDFGIHIAIDDFGAGYTSFRYIKEFPVDTIKIDKRFIEDSLTNVQDSAIIKAIMTLAKELRFRVIAEGVESDDQLKHLLGMDCFLVQGFLFGRPTLAGTFLQNYESNALTI